MFCQYEKKNCWLTWSTAAAASAQQLLAWSTVSVDHSVCFLPAFQRNSNIWEHFKQYGIDTLIWHTKFPFLACFYRAAYVCLNVELFSFFCLNSRPKWCSSKSFSLLPQQSVTKSILFVGRERKKSIEYVYIMSVCVQWVAKEKSIHHANVKLSDQMATLKSTHTHT